MKVRGESSCKNPFSSRVVWESDDDLASSSLLPVPTAPPDFLMDAQYAPPMAQGGIEHSSISLSAQAELELELSLRGSLLVQQQRRIVQLEDELQRAWSEIERLRIKLGALERERTLNDEDGSRQPRYWTPEEHTLFVEAVQRFGWKDVKAISQHVGTRNPTQVRTHAQKLLLRQQKEHAGVMQASNNGREIPPMPPNAGGGHDVDASVLALLPPPDHVGDQHMPGRLPPMAQIARDEPDNPDSDH
jgi:SHAQKYF class myb-like DNA-binding protein